MAESGGREREVGGAGAKDADGGVERAESAAAQAFGDDEEDRGAGREAEDSLRHYKG